jgi:hypothetical protein
MNFFLDGTISGNYASLNFGCFRNTDVDFEWCFALNYLLRKLRIVALASF